MAFAKCDLKPHPIPRDGRNPGWKPAVCGAAVEVTSADDFTTDVTDAALDDVIPAEETSDLALLESGFFIRAAMENSETAWDSFRPSRVLLLVSPTGLIDLTWKGCVFEVI